MLGRVILPEPRVERWGDGHDGTATWSNNSNMGAGNWWSTDGSNNYVNHSSKRTAKSGIYQFDKLTISAGTHIEVTEQGHAVPQKLVIFARQEIIIGDNVLINAGRNNWEKASAEWRAESSNFGGTVSFGTGGGGGGGGGANDGNKGEYGDNAGPYDILLYHNKNGGVNRGSSYYNPHGSTGGAGGWASYNTRGASGHAGWPKTDLQKSGIKNKIKSVFGFSNTKGRHGTDTDDFPMWQGGRGGNGGTAQSGSLTSVGYGGRGGGTIILVAPKISFSGTNHKISIQGNTRKNGCGNDRNAGNKQNKKLSNMNGTHNGGDYGTAGGGGGGGGFCGIVTAPNGLSGWNDNRVVGDGHAEGGLGKTDDGNQGGTGGVGGKGILMRGEKALFTGKIIWKSTNAWFGGTGVEGQ